MFLDVTRHHRDDAKRSSTRSNSTVKVDKYDGDDDTTNGSRRAHNDRYCVWQDSI